MLILLIIIITRAIVLILESLWRCDKATHASLSSCDTTNTGVHLTQLITKSVKASIHALKLHRDGC